MRVLGITETCDLGSLYLRLMADGHQVRVSVSEPFAAGTMAGLVSRSAEWQNDLGWIREAGPDGLILFEAVGFGALQEELRASGLNVIGGSSFGDRLENDRQFAQQLLSGLGAKTTSVHHFTTAAAALADLSRRPRRCVFKMNASAGDTFVGAFEDGSDIIALLEVRPPPLGEPFVLMDHVEGVETGVGAYFNGERFMLPACVDWEHKRFFTGDMGELTGEMGTVATFDGTDTLFEATLLPLEGALRDAGHVGYVNLNAIINDEGVWPLEFTCRFGYPGFAVLEPLQTLPWAKMFGAMISRGVPKFPTAPGFSLGVVLTTPPFPFSRKEVDTPVGLPLRTGDVPDDHLHLGEVGLSGTQLVTSGLYGWTAVITGTGATIERARTQAYARAAQVQSPNLRYRLDIGQKLIAEELALLEKWGWMKSVPLSRIASQIVR